MNPENNIPNSVVVGRDGRMWLLPFSVTGMDLPWLQRGEWQRKREGEWVQWLGGWCSRTDLIEVRKTPNFTYEEIDTRLSRGRVLENGFTIRATIDDAGGRRYCDRIWHTADTVRVRRNND